jgi:hypothetical protein
LQNDGPFHARRRSKHTILTVNPASRTVKRPDSPPLIQEKDLDKYKCKIKRPDSPIGREILSRYKEDVFNKSLAYERPSYRDKVESALSVAMEINS